MLGHFMPEREYRYDYTWIMHRRGIIVTSYCAYLMGTNRCTFLGVCLKDPRYDLDTTWSWE